MCCMLAGVLVAYHNTVRNFAYQFISLQRMDQFLLGSSQAADIVFQHGLQWVQHMLNHCISQSTAHTHADLSTIQLLCVHRGDGCEIFVELLGNPHNEPDAHLPFAQRYSSLRRVHTLTNMQLCEQLSALGESCAGSREELIGRLESCLTPSMLEVGSTEGMDRWIRAEMDKIHCLCWPICVCVV